MGLPLVEHTPSCTLEPLQVTTCIVTMAESQITVGVHCANPKGL